MKIENLRYVYISIFINKETYMQKNSRAFERSNALTHVIILIVDN